MKTSHNKGKTDGLQEGDVVKLVNVWAQDKIFFKGLENGQIGEVHSIDGPDCYVYLENLDHKYLMKQNQVQLLWRPLAKRSIRWVIKRWILDKIRYW